MTPSSDTILSAEGLVKHYPLRRRRLSGPRPVVQAVNDVSFSVGRGRTLGIVGESGSGKSTTARLVLRMMAPTAGSVTFDGVDVLKAGPSAMKQLRQRMQMIFQDPRGSLDPRMRVADVIGEPLVVHKKASGRAIRHRVQELLEMVGMSANDVDKFAHQFSGGQAQRIAIARALATEPELVICDEAVSALDVSVQAQILNLLRRLQDEMGLSYLFISHDLSVVRYMSDDVMVMYLGQVVESGPSEQLFAAPRHPYSRALLASAERGDLRQDEVDTISLRGEPASPSDPPAGCRFHPRCPLAFDRCSTEAPPLLQIAPRRQAACHLVLPEVP